MCALLPSLVDVTATHVSGTFLTMELLFHSPKYGAKTILIDDEDYELIKPYKWSISCVRGQFYMVHTYWPGLKSKTIKMHRLIMGVLGTPKIHIDHIDRNSLNNQKLNMRKATIAENSRNVGPNKRSHTGYKGVYLYKYPNKNAGKYTAALRYDGKTFHGGYFKTAKEAAQKYNEMAIKYHGEFAFINEI